MSQTATTSASLCSRKASSTWSPRLPRPMKPRRMRSLAPRTRRALRAVPRPAKVACWVNWRRFRGMRRTPAASYGETDSLGAHYSGRGRRAGWENRPAHTISTGEHPVHALGQVLEGRGVPGLVARLLGDAPALVAHRVQRLHD